MCGIVGILSNKREFALSEIVSEMSEAMINRGPDSSGIWADGLAGITLGHQRLAILDITSSGHQPMISKSGNFVISFNGEIYNHLNLRAEIEHQFKDCHWVGSSDTETLLECFDRWGIEKTLKKIIGMFAIAVWDRGLNELKLIRDRFGEKPIYYGWQGSDTGKVFLFASELKAIKKHSQFNNQIESDAVFALCKYGFIPQPISIYKNIFKLPPSSILSVSLEKPDVIITTYWSSLEVAKLYKSNKFCGTTKEAVSELEQILGDSVRGAMLSDVPIGVFLSSGIDSALIASIMQANSKGKLSAFTIGFDEKKYDESVQAARISEHLGLDHHILKVNPAMMMEAIQEMPFIYDEPFADSSQIPTYLLSKFAASYVKVCLTGDGGDELFYGYSRHNNGAQKLLNLNTFLGKVKSIIAKILLQLSTKHLDNLAFIFSRKYQNIGEKIHKYAYAIQANSELEYYDRILSSDSENIRFLKDISINKYIDDKNIQLLKNFRFTDQIALLDVLYYLPNDILTKVDRASMSASLETRAPFLNNNVFKFAASLPLFMKSRGAASKLILRQLLSKFVPSSLMQGPKKGFSIPLAEWLRGPLQEWAETLLSECSIMKSGILDPKEVQLLWQEHISGKKNRQQILWSILMFQAWYDAQ